MIFLGLFNEDPIATSIGASLFVFVLIFLIPTMRYFRAKITFDDDFIYVQHLIRSKKIAIQDIQDFGQVYTSTQGNQVSIKLVEIIYKNGDRDRSDAFNILSYTDFQRFVLELVQQTSIKEIIAQGTQPSSIICSNCGHDAGNKKFCPKCGSPINQ